MTKTPLYKYTGSNGMIISPVLLDCAHEDMIRLSADVGNILTDGDTQYCVVDIDPADESKWSEMPFALSLEEENAVQMREVT